MASSKDYLEFVLEQLSELDDISYMNYRHRRRNNFLFYKLWRLKNVRKPDYQARET